MNHCRECEEEIPDRWTLCNYCDPDVCNECGGECSEHDPECEFYDAISAVENWKANWS